MRTTFTPLRWITLALLLAGLGVPAAGAEDLDFELPAAIATTFGTGPVTTQMDADFGLGPLAPKAHYVFGRDHGPQANATSGAQATASLSAFSVMANAASSIAIGEAYMKFTVKDPQHRSKVKVNINYKGSASSAGEDSSAASWRLSVGLPYNDTYVVHTRPDGAISSIDRPVIREPAALEVTGIHKGTTSSGRTAQVEAYRVGAIFLRIVNNASDERSIDLSVFTGIEYLVIVTAGASGIVSGSGVAVIEGGSKGLELDTRGARAETGGSIVTPHPDNPDVVVQLLRAAADPIPRFPLGDITPELLAAQGLDAATLQQMGFFEPLNQAEPTFADVPADHPFFVWIEALVKAGIAGGCAVNPRQYCPDDPVTRGQLAVFLVRGIHGAGFQPPPPTGMVFEDAPVDHVFAAWIEQLARDGLTKGCAETPSLYCPEDEVTREQMAALLLRAKHGAGYQPPAATGAVFGDVPADHPFARWIEQLAFEGITGGCSANPRLYCPDEIVTREEMAVFLVRTFALPM